MNKRALVYLGAASAVLACAFLYVQFKTEAAVQGTTSTSKPATVQDTSAAAVAQIRIQGGKLQTAPLRLKVQAGETARLQVLSDETDELHVHGIDQKFVIFAGQLTTIEIPTRRTGSFELETHDRPMTIGVLEVHPN
ncbi:MAG: hypothetical protein QE278_00600 [Limnobacter sp.]|nr:hypothetical protein [Limnobacter sp.]